MFHAWLSKSIRISHRIRSGPWDKRRKRKLPAAVCLTPDDALGILPPMKYRALGRSGVRVSEVGIGGHREGVETRDGVGRIARFFASDQDRARVVGAAIDAGVTYFDSTYYCEIESLGQSLRLLGRRDGLVVSGMRVDFFANYLRERGDIRAYVRREVEECLQAFGFDHVDQFICGAMEQGDPVSHRPEMEDALDELGRLRHEGKLRLIGFSTHEPDYAAKLLDAFGMFDTAMVPYNFANRAAEGELAAVVKSQNTALIAMKTLVWHIYGIPVTVLRNLRPVSGRLELCPDAPIGRLALQFVLANPLISSCVPAVNSVVAARENASASGRTLDAGELHALEQYAAVMRAEDFVPLGIAALHEGNGRILANALGLLKRTLKLDLPPVDWDAEDAQQKAQQIAKKLLRDLAADPRWAPLIGMADVSGRMPMEALT